MKDAQKLTAAGLQDNAQALLNILEVDPLQNPPLLRSWLVTLRRLLTQN